MSHILEAIYNLLCFLTEDAKAWGLVNLPSPLKETVEKLTNELEKYLDETKA